MRIEGGVPNAAAVLIAENYPTFKDEQRWT
jgi:hypothetical protein